MEHRSRHSRARRRHAKGKLGNAELTAADLRELRRLLAVEDRGGTIDGIDPAERTRHRATGAPRPPESTDVIPVAGGSGLLDGPPDELAGFDDPDDLDPDYDEDDEDQDLLSPGARRVLLGAAQTIVALVSAVVLAGAGIGWAGLANFEQKLNTTDVLDNVPGPVEKEDGGSDILLVGSDSRTDANGNPLPADVLKLLRTEANAGLNTDTIILVRVPEDGGRAFAVSIPRDTYLTIPDYQDDRINAAYGVSKRLERERLLAEGVTDEKRIEQESDQAGRRMLVQVVQQLTGVRVDHYAEINLYGFYLLTEAIGGVEVCLKNDVTDPDSGANFKAGRQFVAGGDALSFVRQRQGLPRGDLDRIVRQQVFMAAVANQVLSAGTLTDPGQMAALMDAAQKSVVLDEGWDVLDFAQQMQGIAAGNVEFVTIPVLDLDHRTEDGKSVVAVDLDQVRAFVAGLVGEDVPELEESTPAEESSSSAPSSTPTADPASVVVSVSNGTHREGMAGRVLDFLAGQGFRVGSADNTSARGISEVRVAPQAKDVGRLIADALGGIAVVEDAGLPRDQANVLLGSDYDGPGVQGMAAGRLLPPHLRQLTGEPRVPDDPHAPITADGVTCVN